MNPPSELVVWLGCLSFILLLLNQGWKFAANVRGSGREQRDVTMLALPVTKEEFQAAQESHKDVQTVIFKKIEHHDDRISESTRVLGERLSGVEQAAVFQNQRLAQMDSKLDRLIERNLRYDK